ncbi:MAG: 3D domain-containing protein [Polyangiales bacterium]
MRRAPSTTLALTAALALTSLSTAARAQTFLPGRWQLTRYWVADERGVNPERVHRAVPISDRAGHTLAWVCDRFATDLAMEGTGRTWDGRLFNWDSRVNGRACFREVDNTLYPFGVGVQGWALVPWRSLAVDSRYVPLGSTVEIPELVGMTLPDGSRHDGCFVAVDGGGAILGHHLDLFLPGTAEHSRLAREAWLPRSVSVVLDSPRCESARRFAIHPLPGDPRATPSDPLHLR